MLEMVYYTRDNCQLCNEGLEQVRVAINELRYSDVKLTMVDIDSEDGLQEKYMVRVPVLEHESKVIQEGIIDFAQVYDYLKDYRGNYR